MLPFVQGPAPLLPWHVVPGVGPLQVLTSTLAPVLLPQEAAGPWSCDSRPLASLRQVHWAHHQVEAVRAARPLHALLFPGPGQQERPGSRPHQGALWAARSVFSVSLACSTLLFVFRFLFSWQVPGAADIHSSLHFLSLSHPEYSSDFTVLCRSSFSPWPLLCGPQCLLGQCFQSQRLACHPRVLGTQCMPGEAPGRRMGFSQRSLKK